MNQSASHCSHCCSHARPSHPAPPTPPTPPPPPSPPQPVFSFGQQGCQRGATAAANALKKRHFTTSAIVGFMAVLLIKNLFMLTSIVGFIFMTLLGLGSQGVINVDWKKAIDMCTLPDLSSLLVVPSKPGFMAGAFFAWRFSP